MKNKYLYQFSYILVCILFWQCIAAAQNSATKTNSAEDADKAKNLVHFGDLIDVDVLGSIEYDWRGRLNPEGFLDGLDYIEEPVFGLCRNEEEIAVDIAKGYEKLLREPKVVVRVIDRSSRALSVLDGAVKKPQRYQIKRSVYLNELIILAGGLTERASGEIRVFRPQNLSCAPRTRETAVSETDENREKFVKTSQNAGSQSFNVKISELLSGTKEANPQILSGDIVTVLEADPIYIIGGVSSPKQISSRTQTTVSRAIASAGGLAKEGLEDSVTIFRRNGIETKIIEVDLNKIKSGQAEDVVLQGFDIVDVGQKGRAKKKYPPIIQLDDINERKLALLPLKIID